MERYGIVGFGCAGYHGAKSLRANGFAGEIDVYTDTSMAPENPCSPPMSPQAGCRGQEPIPLAPWKTSAGS